MAYLYRHTFQGAKPGDDVGLVVIHFGGASVFHLIMAGPAFAFGLVQAPTTAGPALRLFCQHFKSHGCADRHLSIAYRLESLRPILHAG